jgi:hypothetical protein
MAVSTFVGAVLPAVPFAFETGPAAIAESGVLCCGIGVSVSALRANRGLGLALLETFGILLAVIAVTVLCGLFLPGGAG